MTCIWQKNEWVAIHLFCDLLPEYSAVPDEHTSCLCSPQTF
jgi:hypothetical protein